jgi:hypothetical protein
MRFFKDPIKQQTTNDWFHLNKKILGFERFVYFSAWDRNFALENYGDKSMCFDHTDQMWEERSCQQVRQWQHWGSGCYKYFCDAGRLHIEVLNNTYTCFYPQQVSNQDFF